MKVQIRADDSVHIEGYVNAVARDSRVITEQSGEKFVEQIMPGAFKRAILENPDIKIMLNHDRIIGSTKDGTIKLQEDSIGLRAVCDTADKTVVEKAKARKLRGWSFGFSYGDVDKTEKTSEGLERRKVRSLNLEEVSLVDDRKIPCYAGTSIEVRAESVEVKEFRAIDTEIEYEEEPAYNYSAYDATIRALELE